MTADGYFKQEFSKDFNRTREDKWVLIWEYVKLYPPKFEEAEKGSDKWWPLFLQHTSTVERTQRLVRQEHDDELKERGQCFCGCGKEWKTERAKKAENEQHIAHGGNPAFAPNSPHEDIGFQKQKEEMVDVEKAFEQTEQPVQKQEESVKLTEEERKRKIALAYSKAREITNKI